MTLLDFIKDQGAKKVAYISGVTANAVYYWGRCERCPTPDIAHKIVQATSGLVDWNGIYQPYFDSLSQAPTEPIQLTFKDL